MKIHYEIECEQYALQWKELNAPSLEKAGMRVFLNQITNTESVFAALGKGGVIMPLLKGVDVNCEVDDGDLVASVLVSVNHVTKMVRLYVPTKDDIMEMEKDVFLRMWEKTGHRCHTAFPNMPDTYRPDVRKTYEVELPDELDELCERIAEHAHDVWAYERQSEGWTYGPERDDDKLLTPDMVPYSELPDSERQYDRYMAMGTLKFMYSMGYKVIKG